MSDTAQGLALGVGAYLIWGIVPLFWPLLEPASPLEVLAHRVVWSLVVVTVLLLVVRRWTHAVAVLRDRRRMAYVVAGAVAVSINWGTFIYAVNSDRVVEASLGYFINPLITIAFGVVFLRERLRPLQWCALGIAALAVVELTWDYGHLPVIALTLAISFGVYGLLKKQAGIGSIEGLAVETLVMPPRRWPTSRSWPRPAPSASGSTAPGTRCCSPPRVSSRQRRCCCSQERRPG